MLENTHNRGGGKWISPEDTLALAEVAHGHGAMIHIDGARLWNAATAAQRPPRAWGSHVDTLTFCLSKGLGAPVGSVLCGPRAWIGRAHRFRKMLGGGMRQAGMIAAAGLYAIEHHADQLSEDHRRTLTLAEVLSSCPNVHVDMSAVHSNILLFTPLTVTPDTACRALNSTVRVLPFGARQIRAVLHRDINDQDLERAAESLQAYFSSLFVLSLIFYVLWGTFGMS